MRHAPGQAQTPAPNNCTHQNERVMRFPSCPTRRIAAVALLCLLGAAGCGSGLYPVRGKVTYPDGKPVTEGMVVFESKSEEARVTARGEIQSDGSFALSTHKPGDGAPA